MSRYLAGKATSKHAHLRALAFVIVGLVALAVPQQAHALSSYDFLVTFDGATATLDPGSDPVDGTSLVPGDIFRIDVHTVGNDYWQVISSYNAVLFATFGTTTSQTRVADITTTLFLDGVQVAQTVDLAEIQQFVHIGGQVFSFTTGLIFDQLTVDLELLSIDGGITTLDTSSGPDILSFFPFFRDSQIAYVNGPTAVPEPSTLAMFGAGLAGLLVYRRRRVAC
jgi:hypothetical protein